MTKYASSDITSFSNASCPEGGHQRKVSNPKEVRTKGAKPEYADERLVITCESCEPLLRGKDSWSGEESMAPMTRAEQVEADKLQKVGLQHTAMMAEALAGMAQERIAASGTAS